MRHRHRIWWEILKPSWRWGFLVPLGLIGTADTIREHFIIPDHPELYQTLAHFLPHWSWQTYGFIFAGVLLLLILESAYRAINWREELIEEIAVPEETLALLTKLHAEGVRSYQDSGLPVQKYFLNLEAWEAEVTGIIEAKFSASDLHQFKTYVYWGGTEYTLLNEPAESWMMETQKKRAYYTARLVALSELIKYGSSSFLGPKMKIAEIMEARK
jgi:hypothetical protein